MIGFVFTQIRISKPGIKEIRLVLPRMASPKKTPLSAISPLLVALYRQREEARQAKYRLALNIKMVGISDSSDLETCAVGGCISKTRPASEMAKKLFVSS